jgi:hypothetical protein
VLIVEGVVNVAEALLPAFQIFLIDFFSIEQVKFCYCLDETIFHEVLLVDFEESGEPSFDGRGLDETGFLKVFDLIIASLAGEAIGRLFLSRLASHIYTCTVGTHPRSLPNDLTLSHLLKFSLSFLFLL